MESEKPLVAFLGPPSSFTHQATSSVFSDKQHDLVPVVTIKDVFDMVQSGEAKYGVVPLENSTHGVVTFTLDNLADRDRVYGDLTVCGEVYIDVHHFLLGYKSPGHQSQQRQNMPGGGEGGPAPVGTDIDTPGTCTPTANDPHPLRPRSKPLVPLGHLRRVLSHPQAFGQTNAFLATYLRCVDYVDVSSTSKAAEAASRDSSGATAAIAGEIAAETFGLDVLAKCIEDRDDNTTRFFILRKASAGEGGDAAPRFGKTDAGARAKGEGRQEKSGPSAPGTKSLVSFTVPHRAPGALADVLDLFRKHGLNLTSINSLPSLIHPFQYLFFVEFEGSKIVDPDGKVKNALDEIASVAQSWRWLGSWESQR